MFILYQEIENLLPVLDPSALDLFSEHAFRIWIVNSFIKIKRGVFAWRFDGPSREGPRDFDHVFLLVAAVDTECMQLHQLASVIFIQSTLAAERRKFFAR